MDSFVLESPRRKRKPFGILDTVVGIFLDLSDTVELNYLNSVREFLDACETYNVAKVYVFLLDFSPNSQESNIAAAKASLLKLSIYPFDLWVVCASEFMFKEEIKHSLFLKEALTDEAKERYESLERFYDANRNGYAKAVTKWIIQQSKLPTNKMLNPELKQYALMMSTFYMLLQRFDLSFTLSVRGKLDGYLSCLEKGPDFLKNERPHLVLTDSGELVTASSCPAYVPTSFFYGKRVNCLKMTIQELVHIGFPVETIVRIRDEFMAQMEHELGGASSADAEKRSALVWRK
ncbi:MAG TPA: hypothetical protein VGV92_04235 [Gammaproteobacteria bacterium]|nr:hypothetical protein [Gammaproteobacteria bacterium]